MDMTTKEKTMADIVPMIEKQDEVKQARILGYVEGISASQPNQKKKAEEEEAVVEEEAV